MTLYQIIHDYIGITSADATGALCLVVAVNFVLVLACIMKAVFK